jgi:hypothetical protein
MVQIRGIVVAVAAAALLWTAAALAADDDKQSTGERVLSGVVTGLLGGPQQAPDAAYAAQERERLASLLASGEYATSRQGEPIDTVVLGIPLTRAEHVYSARPVPPSRTGR